MANSSSARKQARVNLRRRLINQMNRSHLATAEKKLRHLVNQGDKTKINDQLKAVYSLADRCAKTGVISRNAAARKKSRLSTLAQPKK